MQNKPSMEKQRENEYQDYTTTSKLYDQTRLAVGLKEIKDFVKEHLKIQIQKGEKTVLVEVGCGTGNYLIPVSEEFDSAIGIDLNQGMLAQAAKKVEQQKKAEKIQLINGIAQDLPLKNESASVVTAIQTIHHYGSDQNIIAFIKEAHRVLKPGGIMIINHTTSEQIASDWFIHFSDRVLDQCKKKFSKREDIIGFGEKNGFKLVNEIIFKESCQEKEKYLNPELYLTKEARAWDSVWSLYKEDELNVALEKIKAIIKEGNFEEWRMKHGGGDIEQTLGVSSHFVFIKE